MAELDPWDRRADETPVAYAAFTEYLDMGGERSTEHVARKLGKSNTLIGRWCTRHDWVERSRAWDSVPKRAVADAYQEMARDIAEQHRALGTKLMERLSRNLDLLPEGADPTIRWSTAQAAAHRSHSFATDLVKPASTSTDEINEAIITLLNKLSGE